MSVPAVCMPTDVGSFYGNCPLHLTDYNRGSQCGGGASAAAVGAHATEVFVVTLNIAVIPSAYIFISPVSDGLIIFKLVETMQIVVVKHALFAVWRLIVVSGNYFSVLD